MPILNGTFLCFKMCAHLGTYFKVTTICWEREREREREREMACYFNVIVFQMSCDCMCSVALPHDAVGLSAVCDCGIS